MDLGVWCDKREYVDSGCFNMSDTEDSDSQLYEILKVCARVESFESLLNYAYNDVYLPDFHMISTKTYSTSSIASDESIGLDNILEENGRISLAYENLRTIPRRLADKYAAQTKFLDLSYNKIQNLTFLSFFDGLDTLILDRNNSLDMHTFPYLPNLKILWINNCDITNVTEWIKRIQTQCPNLVQLSIMGNPGIKNVISYCTFTSSDTLVEQPPEPILRVADYSEYILHMLPKLEYLDGIQRSVQTKRAAAAITNESQLHISNGKISPATSMANGSDPNHASGIQSSNHKNYSGKEMTSSKISFKDLFRFSKRRKMSS